MIWPYIVLSYLSLFALGLSDNIRGPLFPEVLRSFAVSDSVGSWVFALSSMFGFTASFLARKALRRFDRIHLLQGATALMVLALIGFYFSPSFSTFLLFSCLYGFAIGLLGVLQNILVSVGSTTERRKQMLSGLHSTYGLSSLLAPLIVAEVASQGADWRLSFLLVAAVPLALLFYSAKGVEKVEAARIPPPLKKGRVADQKNQLFMAVMMGSYVVAEILMSTRLALYLRREQGATLEESSFYVTGFFVALLAGRLLFTFLHLKMDLKKQLVIFLCASIWCCLAGVFWHPYWLVLSGFAMAPFYPLGVAYLSEIFPSEIDSVISYTVTIQSFLIVVMHLSVGVLTDILGISWALLVGPLFLLISLILLNTYSKVFKSFEL